MPEIMEMEAASRAGPGMVIICSIQQNPAELKWKKIYLINLQFSLDCLMKTNRQLIKAVRGSIPSHASQPTVYSPVDCEEVCSKLGTTPETVTETNNLLIYSSVA